MLNIDTAIITQNLSSPVILGFFFGVIASIVKSDLKFPDNFFNAISSYLLLALGIKGGVCLINTNLLNLLKPSILTICISLSIPLIIFFICFKIAKLSRENSAALAAHYGSVSIVTFMAACIFIEQNNLKASDFMTGMVALMEVPGIIVALLLANNVFDKKVVKGIGLLSRIRSIFFSKSIYLLWSGILIGMICGTEGLKKVSGFFVEPFYGVLVLFMLEMGVLAGNKMSEIRKIGKFLIALGIVTPIFIGTLIVTICYFLNFTMADSVVFASIASSASYIAAPAAVRVSLPFANPAYYLTASLAITFPFNLTMGIPIYFLIARWLFS